MLKNCKMTFLIALMTTATTFLTPFFSYSMEMEIEQSEIEEKKKWHIEEVKLYVNNNGWRGDSFRVTKFAGEDSFLDSIQVINFENNITNKRELSIFIKASYDFYSKYQEKNKQKIEELREYFESADVRQYVQSDPYLLLYDRAQKPVNCETPLGVASFLQAFYVKNLISDYLMDVLKNHIENIGYPFDDFRLTLEKFIIQINDQLSESPTAEEFQSIAAIELSKVYDPTRRQVLIWDFSQFFLRQREVHKPTVIMFLNMITDPNSPFFVNAKSQLADLVASEENDGGTWQERSKKRLVNLLDATQAANNGADVHKDLNVQVKAFIFGNELTTKPIPPGLNNLTVTSNAIIGLLDYIRCQHERIRELERPTK